MFVLFSVVVAGMQ